VLAVERYDEYRGGDGDYDVGPSDVYERWVSDDDVVEGFGAEAGGEGEEAEVLLA
jgi:hypothetical protein